MAFHRQTLRLDPVAQAAEDLKALEKAKLRDRKRAGVGKLRGPSEMISLEEIGHGWDWEVLEVASSSSLLNFKSPGQFRRNGTLIFFVDVLRSIL